MITMGQIYGKRLPCMGENLKFPLHTEATQALMQSSPKFWSKLGLKKTGKYVPRKCTSAPKCCGVAENPTTSHQY